MKGEVGFYAALIASQVWLSTLTVAGIVFGFLWIGLALVALNNMRKDNERN
jgi:hypothetical protein